MRKIKYVFNTTGDYYLFDNNLIIAIGDKTNMTNLNMTICLCLLLIINIFVYC